MLIITTCTNRKRLAPSPLLCGRNLQPRSASEFCHDWLSRVAADRARRPVRELYCGRGFAEAAAAADWLEADLFVVSAGLGLVSADAVAPSYSLTLSSGSPDSVAPKIAASPAAWWRCLQNHAPFEADVGAANGVILAALSRPYLEMVADDWARWPQERLQRLRLFSKEPPASLPPELRECWMPYDDRLDQVEGWAGTQSDFAQRALGHFARNFVNAPGDAQDQAAQVRDVLSTRTRQARPIRTRLSDDELVELIQRSWEQVGGRSGAMHRHLRHDLQVACEQGRFKDLFKRAMAERQGALL